MFLVFTECLISLPSVCSDAHVPIPDDVSSTTACWVGAPAIIIEWEKQHPDRKAAMDWRCVPANRLERRS